MYDSFSQCAIAELRSRLAIIPQEPTLFSGTIRKNLDPLEKSTDEDVWAALDMVSLKSVIQRKPEQLDAPVTEGGAYSTVIDLQRSTVWIALHWLLCLRYECGCLYVCMFGFECYDDICVIRVSAMLAFEFIASVLRFSCARRRELEPRSAPADLYGACFAEAMQSCDFGRSHGSL